VWETGELLDKKKREQISLVWEYKAVATAAFKLQQLIQAALWQLRDQQQRQLVYSNSRCTNQQQQQEQSLCPTCFSGCRIISNSSNQLQKQQ
jgi:hypothetical protein